MTLDILFIQRLLSAFLSECENFMLNYGENYLDGYALPKKKILKYGFLHQKDIRFKRSAFSKIILKLLFFFSK